MTLADRVRAGEQRAVARAITVVERGGPGAEALLHELGPSEALVVGLTGPPGAGKSTLAAALVGHLRARGIPVAVLAIDPSSPFTGGAVLGDRIRMTEHFLDPGVFIRSMATRGEAGGLTAAAGDAVHVLAAAGYGTVLLETVGVGQDEVAVTGAADVVVLTLTPDSGDAVQAIKAGLMEIPDVIALTKCDRPGSGRFAGELRGVLSTGPEAPTLVPTAAIAGTGVAELWEAVAASHAQLRGNGRLRQRRRDALAARLSAQAVARLAERLDPAQLRDLAEQVAAGSLSRAAAVEALLRPLGGVTAEGSRGVRPSAR